MKYYFLAIASILLISCNSGKPEEGEFVRYYCGAEVREGEGNRAYFVNDGNEFHGGAAQSSEDAYEGEYSVRLDTTNKYGFSITLDNVEVGEYFEVSCQVKQKYKHGTIIVELLGETKNVIRTYDENFTEDKNGWKHHHMSFSVANPIDEIKFYTFSNGFDCFFDEFEVIRWGSRPPIEGYDDKMLSIHIPDSANQVLEGYKELAVKEAVIRDEYKEYVDAYILNGSDSLPVEMRLKGDWVDHLVSGKASYRIKTSEKGCFQQLRSFSIQHPKTRNYMHEWFLHELCDMEDLLSTRYDFLPVEINGLSHGVYALEEHFDKHLLESRKRREGPILKMDESGFWSLIANGDSLKKDKSFPYFAASFISCFKKGRTTGSDVLFSQFKLGSILLDRYKNLDHFPDELFDVERMAKFYALMDLGNVHHGLAWHNRRFYYNPVTTILEPVGFDMQPGMLPIAELMPIRQILRKDKEWYDEFLLDHALLLNKDFRRTYTAEIKRFSRKEFLDSVFEVMDQEINEKEKLLGHEVKNYHFNREIYYEIADSNRKHFDSLDIFWDIYEAEYANKGAEPRKHDFTPNETDFHISEMALNCYRTKLDSASYLIEVENFHLNEVTLIGYSIKANKDSVIRFEDGTTLAAFNDHIETPRLDLMLDKKAVRIFYKAANNRDLQYRNVLKWPRPKGEHPRVELSRKFNPNSKYYKINGDTLTLNGGNYVINELVYIPKGYKVKFQPSTLIAFQTGGGLIMNDDVVMVGKQKQPILFIDDDSTSQGITILGADKVEIKHVHLTNMGTLDYKGWTLTGALTVYESAVDISYLTISGNRCEDALNTIRCEIDVSALNIQNTFSDGYDADFCTGVFDSSRFANTGNDAVDFSGSEVMISDITMNMVGDKGISGGERSSLIIRNVKIFGCLTGLASKDDSRLDADGIKITDSPIGIACFQKKPEFGPGHIDIRNAEYEDVENLGIIELGSSANWDGKDYRGFVKFDIEAMYARFDK